MLVLTIFIVVLLGSMALGVPISFALIICASALMLHMNMLDSQIVAANLIGGVDQFPLLAIPFFILAGEVMNAGGLSRRIVTFASALVGHLRGGLGYVTILSGTVLASLSGSAIADAAALAALLTPMMVQAGHSRSRSAGLIASSAIIAPIIPPSIAFVMFGVIANVSITKLFLAGIAPGLMLAMSLAVAWLIVSRREDVTPLPKRSAAEVWTAFRDSIFALGLPIIIVVGLKLGIVTPTEAAALAAVYALIVALFVYRELSPRMLYAVIVRASLVSGVALFLIAAAMIPAWMITLSGIARAIADIVAPLVDHPRILMFVILALVLVVGTALDMAPTTLILVPLLMPVVRVAGIDPVYFGVVFVMASALSLLTPPVGNVLNVVASVAGGRFEEVARGVTPFLVAQIAVIALLCLWPSLVLVPASWLY